MKENSSLMKKNFSIKRTVLQFFIGLLFLLFLLCITHRSIYNYVLQDLTLYHSIKHIYFFLGGVFLASYIFMILTYLVSNKHLGVVYIIGVLLKMFASIWFLYPFIKSDLINKIPDVINFFIPFFLFLIFEVYFSLKLLKP